MYSEKLEKNEYLELEILNCVESSPNLSTRVIATRLGCNLRLTHALLKKLINKGLLEVKKENSRKWNYFLTPNGLVEKTKKTYKFFKFSMQFYQNARESSTELCNKLAKNGTYNLAFYGCGNLAEIVYLSLVENQLKLIEVYGANRLDFMGCKVMDWEDVKSSKADVLIECIFDKNRPCLKILDTLEFKKIERIF